MNATKMIVSVAVAILFYIAAAAASEVCQWQTFEAKCAKDEVIVMREARYGRMNVGKCLSRNYFVGCSANVVDYMHGRCSGRRHCRVPVPDPIMFAASPCPKDLVSYLDADYECVKVAKWNKDSCDEVMTASSGMIAKPVDSAEDLHKRHHCPRRIVAQPGQIINIYLSDFYNKHHHESTSAPTTATHIPECINYGHIAEDGISAPAKICGGKFQKDQLVYRSKSNVVDITLSAPTSHAHHFLFRYEVIGCPILHAPQNGWIEIIKDSATIHCNNSHTASTLICSGNKWVGQAQNCSSHDMPIAASMAGMPFTNLFSNSSLLVVVCVGVALGVLVGIGFLVFAVTLYGTSKAKQVQQPASQQSSQASPIKKSQEGSNQGIVYSYLPVVDPNFEPMVSDVYGTKALMPSNPINHIINHNYECPYTSSLTSFKNTSVALAGDNTVILMN